MPGQLIDLEAGKKDWASIKGIHPAECTSPRSRLFHRRLRTYMAMRYAALNPILDELMKEGRIIISGDTISLAVR